MILFEIIFIKNIQIIKPNKHTKNDRIKKLNFTYSIPIKLCVAIINYSSP